MRYCDCWSLDCRPPPFSCDGMIGLRSLWYCTFLPPTTGNPRKSTPNKYISVNIGREASTIYHPYVLHGKTTGNRGKSTLKKHSSQYRPWGHWTCRPYVLQCERKSRLIVSASWSNVFHERSLRRGHPMSFVLKRVLCSKIIRRPKNGAYWSCPSSNVSYHPWGVMVQSN